MRFLLFFISGIFSLIFFLFAQNYGGINLKLGFSSGGLISLYGNIFYSSLFFLILGVLFFLFFTDFSKNKKESSIDLGELLKYIKNNIGEITFFILSIMFSLIIYYFLQILEKDTFLRIFYLFGIQLGLFGITHVNYIKNNQNITILSKITAMFLFYIVSFLGSIELLTNNNNILLIGILVYAFIFHFYYYFKYKNIISGILSLLLTTIFVYVYLFDYLVGIIYK